MSSGGKINKISNRYVSLRRKCNFQAENYGSKCHWHNISNKKCGPFAIFIVSIEKGKFI